MKIETIKDLGALIDLCRRKGVDSITVDGIEMKLGDAPARSRRAKDDGKNPETEQAFSDEDIALWSAGGVDNG